MLMEEPRRPPLPRRPPHRGLLLALAVTAEHRDCRPPLQPRQLLAGLNGDLFHELWLVAGIVEIGEHEVLPEQDPAGIAPIEKGIALVDHRPADPEHVHPGADDLIEGLVERFRRIGERYRVERSPARPPAEHRRPVHTDREVVGCDAERH